MTDTTIAPTIARADAVGYQAAQEGAALYVSAERGRIWMRDRDRAALLHRLSTNHIERLQAGQGTQTVLTTPIGRIIDLLGVYALDDGLLLLTSAGHGPTVHNHLRKNIFFNDKVKLEDASATLGQLTLYGPRAAALFGTLGLPADTLPPLGIVASTWQAAPLYLARSAAEGAYELIAPPAALDELTAGLRAAGAHLLDEATHEVLRIEAGQGAAGRELSQEYIPLETGLWQAVSFQKGCYVGQEIIARMESRGRLAKQLRGLRFAEPPSEPTLPGQLVVAGKGAGDLTSLAESPRFGVIGLAYVRTAHAEPGTVVEAAGLPATVVGLPFG